MGALEDAHGELEKHTAALEKAGYTTARLLYVTPRTLHRRLQREQTSYKQILREVRHALAIEHLKSGRLSVEEIAWTLGYSDVANFRRAFRQWEGVAPSDYRQQ